ncbi:MAG: hypothetical protein AB7E72_14655 [Lysobacterales bacterium]
MSVRRLLQMILAIPALHAAALSAATYTVGGAGCQFSSLQSAIHQAGLTPEADVIRIAGNTNYTFQALVKADPFKLGLVGGYPNCLPAALPNGQTRINGSGLDASVLGIFGGEVELANLVFTGGAPRHGRGGGVLVGAPTLAVAFQNVRITGNSALEGGGLAIVGAPNHTISVHSQRLIIDHNISTDAGGGLWATYAQAIKQSAAWLISRNEAGGDGGGAWLGEDAVFHLYSSKDPSGFVDNLAKGDGGGVALVRGSLTLYHNGGAAQPTEISRNTAARGGGISLYSDAGGSTSVQAHEIIGHDNLALVEGGFASIRMIGEDGRVATGELHVDANHFFGGAPCGSVLDCNLFRGNTAMGADGRLQPGALVSIRNQGKFAVGLARFWNSTVRESIGRDLAHHWSDAESGYAEEIDFRESLIVHNLTEKHLIETEGDGSLNIFGSTFARNDSGAATLQVDDAGFAYLMGSIFDDQARFMDQIPVHQSLFALMVREPGAAEGMSLIFRDDPMFEDPDHDDFRLRAASPALDRQWDVVTGNFLDRAGNPRTVDLPWVPDFNTPRDLGCFERQ